MLKFVNLKKLTAHSLIGVLFAANFVTNLSTNQAVASQDDTSNIDWSVYTDSNFAPIVSTPSSPLPTRTLVNPSFEFPAANSNYNAMEAYIPGAGETTTGGKQIIEGWYSTHGASKGANSLVEIWANTATKNMINVWNTNTSVAAEGNQVAELNAEQSSALYQDICVMADEPVRWSAAHKGRWSSSVVDEAEVFISDPNSWTGKTFSGNKLYNAVIATSNDASISSITPITGSGGQASKTTVNTEWAKYSDVWTGPSSSQEYRFAFQSKSTAYSDTVGNVLDDIQIELSPTVEFVETDETNLVNALNVEGDIYYLTLRVNGNLLSQGTVDITPTGNTNITGSDFTIGTLVAGDGAAVASGVSATSLSDGTIRLALPQGSYDRNNVVDYITIPLVFSDFTDIKTATYELKTANMSGGGENGILNLITANGSGNCSSDTEHTFSLKSPTYQEIDENDVSLELVLSVDVSASINDNEYSKQVQGYVKAFEDSEVQDAIKSLPKGMVVNMQFWGHQRVTDIGWFKLKKDGESIDGLTEFINAINAVDRNLPDRKITINGTTIKVGGGTDIKLAIDEATSLIQSNDYIGDRLVIDVSGDGIPKNTKYNKARATAKYGYVHKECGYTLDCPPVENARDAAIAAGITINGLPINGNVTTKKVKDKNKKRVTVSLFEDQIDDYYRNQVVGGENSFTLLAEGFNDFQRAAKLKILKEISNDPTCNADDKCLPPLPPLPDPTSDADADNNGILDVDEFARDGGSQTADLDGDGIPNYQDLDDDGDNIADVMELHSPSSIENTGTSSMPVAPDSNTTVTLPNPPKNSDGETINIKDADAIDSDGIGKANYQDTDSDDDTISDLIEAGDTNLATAPLDSELDGTANYIDLDSDNDVISDRIEARISSSSTTPASSDDDGIYDYIDTDSDNDFISDKYEANAGGNFALGDTPINSDGDDNPDYIDTDSDDDNISDKHESGKTASDDISNDPINTDTKDKVDYLDTDSDNDGILDINEAGDTSLTTLPYNSDSYISGDSLPDYRDLDSDDNSILDATEKLAANQDIDGDQIKNFQDLDDDGDNIPDVIEIGGGTPLNSDNANDGADYQDTDSDNDLIPDAEEGIKTSTTNATSVSVTYPNSSNPSYILLDVSTTDTKKDGDDCVDTETCGISVDSNASGDGTVDIQGTITGLDYQTTNFSD